MFTMWRSALLVVGVFTVAAYDFDAHDQNEFADSPNEDEPVTRKPVQVSDFTSLVTTTKDVEGEVEKLLGQVEFHYDDPATTPPPTASPENRVTDSEVERSTPERSQDPEKKVVSEWSYEVSDPLTNPAPVSRSLALRSSASVEPTRTSIGRSTYSRRPRLRTRSTRHPISEVVYSVMVPWEAEHPRIGQREPPGVIERLVGGHEIVRYEAVPTRTDYNLGGTRQQLDEARRYMVTFPARLTTTVTRRPRPTPTTLPLVTIYKWTRMTVKHPNCTDSYYECLTLCFDRKGYKLTCPWDKKPPRPEPARLNFTGLFHALQSPLDDWDTSNVLAKMRQSLLDNGYRDCRYTFTTTTTLPKLYPIYYDDMASNKTGKIVAKCWVCGLLEYGIPRHSHCADNFDGNSNSYSIKEKNSYRRYCRYMDEVPLWFNRSDPFSIWGTWTGGCTARWIDLSGQYTQRACRSTEHPATGNHFLSKRMSMLELGLRDVTDGCVVSPMATLVPFSRAVSLYARVHVCVCTGNFCNHASRKHSSIYYISIMISLLGLRL